MATVDISVYAGIADLASGGLTVIDGSPDRGLNEMRIAVIKQDMQLGGGEG